MLNRAVDQLDERAEVAAGTLLLCSVLARHLEAGNFRET